MFLKVFSKLKWLHNYFFCLVGCFFPWEEEKLKTLISTPKYVTEVHDKINPWALTETYKVRFTVVDIE